MKHEVWAALGGSMLEPMGEFDDREAAEGYLEGIEPMGYKGEVRSA